MTESSSTPKSKNLGLIGVGLMGHGIALNLLKKGNNLTVLDHPGNQPLDDLLPLGVKIVKTIAEVAAASEMVLVCVTGSPQVEAIVLGTATSDGLVKSLKSGMMVIECSTSQPASTKKVAAQVLETGARFIDAAMTRTPKEAAEGRLNLLLGGSQDDINLAMPVLKCFAENIYHAGDIGSGHALKLLHNYVSLGSIALISEAAACAGEMGVASDVFTRVLSEGGGSGIALERLRSYLLARDPSGLKFSLANAVKDLDYYGEMAAAAGVHRSIAQGVQTALHDAAKKAKPETMTPELVTLLAPEK